MLGAKGLHGERVQRVPQALDQFLGAARAGRIHGQPAVGEVQPGEGRAPPGQCPGPQFIGHPRLQLPHLAPSDRVALLLFQLHRPLLRHLIDDGRRQQLLVDAQTQQVLLSLGVQGPLLIATGHEAPGLHVEAAAGLERPALEGLFEAGGSEGKTGRQTIENQILE